MTKTPDAELVERLRGPIGGYNFDPLCIEAADRILALSSALKGLLAKERRRYDDTPEAEQFYRKEFASELAALNRPTERN